MLAHVTNGLYIAGANGPFYVIISLDFSVTFDTLSHLLFLKKNFFFSFCDILSRPSSLGILFQAPFSLHAPHILVLPSARRPYLDSAFYIFSLMMVLYTPLVSIITCDIFSLESSDKLWTCAVQIQ